MEFHLLPNDFDDSPIPIQHPKFRCILFCETMHYRISIDYI